MFIINANIYHSTEIKPTQKKQMENIELKTKISG